VWLRANTLRAAAGELLARLGSERPQLAMTRSPLLDEALRVDGAGDLFATRAYGEGLFSSQDLGAQLIGRLVAPRAGEKLLDACAGVGGKSMHLAALTGGAATIDAADRSERKLELLSDHARRLGVSSVRTVLADLTDPSAPLGTGDDGVLLDAPCSGMGVLRRHPEAKWRGGDASAELLELQRALLDAVAWRVAPGGRLVYSVCTFTDEEGPRQVEGFLAAHPEFGIEAPGEPPLGPLIDGSGALRTWPHRHDADAFYTVRLRRRAPSRS
jgi:16S rRNA (cytosine967-C5)-methyltransferase